MPDLFDYGKSRAERDAGMALVRDHNQEFSYQFYHFVLALPSGWVGQCEDIRRVWCGIKPKHPMRGVRAGDRQRKKVCWWSCRRRPQ